MRHTFTKGGKVRWNQSRTENDLFGQDLKKRCGDGPFVIANARLVDTRCTCGPVAYDEDAPHHAQCGVYARETVGHHQFVELVGIEGTFSGAWFSPAN